MTIPSVVEAAIKQQADALAAYRQTSISAVTAKSPLWNMVDNTADQSYEDVVKGAEITALDTTLSAVSFGNNTSIKAWFTLHNTYFATYGDTGAQTFALGIGAFGWRMSAEVNDYYKEANGSYLTAALFFPSELLNMGSLTKTGDVFVAGTAIDTSAYGPGRIAMTNVALLGAAALTVTATLTKVDTTSATISATLNAASAAGSDVIFGEQALTADLTVGNSTITVAATTQFTVGESVLLVDTTTILSEVLVVQSIVAATSVTFTTAAINPYLLANTATATPLYIGVTAATTSTGTAGDVVNFRPEADRFLNL